MSAVSNLIYFRLFLAPDSRTIACMPRPKGLAKTGGRVRGTPNRKTELVAKTLAKLGCDPVEGLARIALDPETKVEIKVRCLTELAQYVYPKRKAVDVSSSEESEFKVTLEFLGQPKIRSGNLPSPRMLGTTLSDTQVTTKAAEP